MNTNQKLNELLENLNTSGRNIYVHAKDIELVNAKFHSISEVLWENNESVKCLYTGELSHQIDTVPTVVGPLLVAKLSEEDLPFIRFHAGGKFPHFPVVYVTNHTPAELEKRSGKVVADEILAETDVVDLDEDNYPRETA